VPGTTAVWCGTPRRTRVAAISSCWTSGTNSVVLFAKYIGGAPGVADSAGEASVYLHGHTSAMQSNKIAGSAVAATFW